MKQLEELPKEPIIGCEYIMNNGEIVKCLDSTVENLCAGCIISCINMCYSINCMSRERKDKKDIKIVRC